MTTRIFRAPFVPVLMLSLAFSPLTTPAQDAPKKEAVPKPALSSSAAVLDLWNYVANKIITMAEDFPEDKYDFKPVPAERSFAEQLLHAANANYFFINPARGQKIPARKTRTVVTSKTRATSSLS